MCEFEIFELIFELLLLFTVHFIIIIGPLILFTVPLIKSYFHSNFNNFSQSENFHIHSTLLKYPNPFVVEYCPK